MIDERPPVGITELVLRDAHQSLLATRFRLEDMLPIADKLDQVGFWSVESGRRHFRRLCPLPWRRPLVPHPRTEKAIPNTRHQMLFRAQNILGYRHYADDVVDKFCERAHTNGVDVFRIFDAMNDPRNFETAIKGVKKVGAHARRGALSYTVSPVHTLDTWLTLAQQLKDMGADTIWHWDMAGLLRPYVCFELVKRLKKEVGLPVHMQSHATTGMATPTLVKAIEAGIDNVDTAISSMSMTYGHPATETLNAVFEGMPGDPGLNLNLLAEIAEYFRGVRKKYAKFEGALKGIDARILQAQVPGVYVDEHGKSAARAGCH